MVVSTILLTKSNKYIDANGNLPKRPTHDKTLLAELVSSQLSVSEEGYNTLPPSIQKLCIVDTNYKMLITIPEIANSELLIVSRSTEDFEDGKEFRLDNFKCLVKDRKVELWISMK